MGKEIKRPRMFSMRCDDEFMEKLEQFAADIGESKTRAVEYAIEMYPKLAKLLTDDTE